MSEPDLGGRRGTVESDQSESQPALLGKTLHDVANEGLMRLVLLPALQVDLLVGCERFIDALRILDDLDDRTAARAQLLGLAR